MQGYSRIEQHCQRYNASKDTPQHYDTATEKQLRAAEKKGERINRNRANQRRRMHSITRKKVVKGLNECNPWQPKKGNIQTKYKPNTNNNILQQTGLK